VAARIVNYGELREYLVTRLKRQVAITGDEDLAALLELVAAGYPAPEREHDPASDTVAAEILTPLMRLHAPDGGELSFFGTVATFGTAAEVTTSELSIELFFPADAATAEVLQNLPRR
jgi:MmyB-like transcription regulator ligand binding domain